MIRSILIHAVMTLCTSALLAYPSAQAASAQLSPEAVINQFFRSDVPLPGADSKDDRIRKTFKAGVIQWLGNYQGVQKENNRYQVRFEGGQVPVTVQFKPDGNPKSISVVGCPATSMPIAKAPSDWRQPLLANCPRLKP